MEDQKRNQGSNPIYCLLSKRIKYLRINLSKEAKDLYSKTNKQTNKNRKYKILMKEIKMTQTDGKIYHGFGLEEYCENDSTLQNNLQI